MVSFEVALEAFCAVELAHHLKKGLRKRWDGVRRKRPELEWEEAKLFMSEHLPKVVEEQRLYLLQRKKDLTLALEEIRQALEDLDYESL